MKRLLFTFFIFLSLILVGCQPKGQANESSELEDSKIQLSDQYMKIAYDGFDVVTPYGKSAREITEQEDIDNIMKSLLPEKWELMQDDSIVTEQVITLTCYITKDNAEEFHLYLADQKEYVRYQDEFYLMPTGTYAHIATLLQSYSYLSSDPNMEDYDLTQTLYLMLSNPNLKIYADNFTIKEIEEQEIKQYISAFSVDEWKILDNVKEDSLEEPGSSIYFISANIELSITEYKGFCLAEISTKMNQFVYQIPSQVPKKIETLSQQE